MAYAGGSMSARTAKRELLPSLKSFATPGGGGGSYSAREELKRPWRRGFHPQPSLGLTSTDPTETREAILKLRQGTRRQTVSDRQMFKDQSRLFQQLWGQRLADTSADAGMSQTPRMAVGDHRVASGRAGPWYGSISETQGDRLKQQRELRWVTGRVEGREKKARVAAAAARKPRKPKRRRGRIARPEPPAAAPSGVDEPEMVWTCCSWSPDRRTIVLGAEDATAVVIDAASMAPRYRLSGLWSRATKCCGWSSDNAFFCIGAGDYVSTPAMPSTADAQGCVLRIACVFQSATIIEAATGAVFQTIRNVHNAIIECCCFSPDSGLLCLGASDGTASLIHVHDGSVLHKIKMTDGESVPSCGFSPDGTIVCLATDVNIALLIDTVTGRPLRRITDVGGPSMVESLHLDARLPKQMDFLESVNAVPPSTARSSAMGPTRGSLEASPPRAPPPVIIPEAAPSPPPELMPNTGDQVVLKSDRSVLMNVVKVGDDGSYTMQIRTQSPPQLGFRGAPLRDHLCLQVPICNGEQAPDVRELQVAAGRPRDMRLAGRCPFRCVRTWSRIDLLRGLR